MMNELKNVLTWIDDENADEDTVLIEGITLYTALKDSGEISGKTRYLWVEELPNVYAMKDAQFKINVDPTFSGIVDVFDETAHSDMSNINVPLHMAIQRALIL